MAKHDLRDMGGIRVMIARKWPAVIALACGLSGLVYGITTNGFPFIILGAALAALSVWTLYTRMQRK